MANFDVSETIWGFNEKPRMVHDGLTSVINQICESIFYLILEKRKKKKKKKNYLYV